MTLGLFIIFSLLANNKKMLLVNSVIYLVAGLTLFFYLIVQEMQANSQGMKPIDKSKPEIYYSVFIEIIITLNIVSGVFRILGGLFMLIFVRISTKISKSIILLILVNFELRPFLIGDSTMYSTGYETQNEISKFSIYSKINHTRIFDLKREDYPRKNFQTFADYNEHKKRLNDISSTASEFDSKSETIKNQKDLNIYINNNPSNQIHVHVYNYNMFKGVNNSSLIDNGTLESNTGDRQVEALYETPRGSMCEKC